MKSILTLFIYAMIVILEFSGSSSLFSYQSICLILLPIFEIIYQLLTNKNNNSFFVNLKLKPVKFLLLFYLLEILSLLYSYDFSASLEYIIKFTFCLLFILICCRNQKFWIKLKNILFYVSVFVGLTILITTIYPNIFIDHFSFLLPTTSGRMEMYLSELRQGIYSGILFERAYAAFSLNIGLCCFISDYFSNKKISKVKILGFIVILISLFCTGKRTLFIIPIISFIVLSILNNKNKNITLTLLKVIPIILIIAIVVINFVPSSRIVFERLSFDKNETMNIRTESYWNYAIDMFSDKPVLGHGISTYASYLSNFRSDQLYYAHNIYIQIAGELGIIGLIIVLVFFILNYLLNLRLLKYGKLGDRNLLLINFSICIQNLFLIYGLTGNPMYYFSQLFFYLLTISISSCVYDNIYKNYDNRRKYEK